MMKNTDRVVGLCFIAIAIVFYFSTVNLPVESQGYPRFLIAIMTFLAILLLIKSFISNTGKTWTELFEHIRWKRFLTVFVVSLLYLVIMNFLGYFMATILYFIVMLITLKASRFTLLVTTPIFILGIFVIFRLFLKVPLPNGLFI